MSQVILFTQRTSFTFKYDTLLSRLVNKEAFPGTKYSEKGEDGRMGRPVLIPISVALSDYKLF